VAAVIMAEIIVIRTIHITLVAPAIPILAVFIVAVRSQEVIAGYKNEGQQAFVPNFSMSRADVRP
jgi:ABC-type tungstate transport system permease subunit